MATEPSFGAWMRRRRRQLDLTQEELAQQAGCSTFTIRKLEVDERRPSKQLAERLALFLAIPAEEQARFVAFARAKPDQEGAPPDPPTEAEPWADQSSAARSKTARRLEWGEAPDVTAFYGREAEQAQLRRWLLEDRCRLVALLGMGGIGKTALATLMAQELAPHFDLILWRSLRNAPPLGDLLDECLGFLNGGKSKELESNIERRIGLLIEALADRRALIVLDNGEAILQAGAEAGHYRPGYEGYGDLLQIVGQGRHQSCLLLTSREKPREVARLEGEHTPVRSLMLKSLTAADGLAILADKGIKGDMEAARQLTARYSGNPLAIKVTAETIRELFAGDIAAFLREETTILGDVRELLAAQFVRLSALEQELMLWLAVEREAVGAETLAGDLVQPVGKGMLFERLSSLHRRSLVEQSEMGFTLQNVVMEFLTDFLVERVFEEISEGKVTGTPQHATMSVTSEQSASHLPRYLQRYALVKAQAKEYVRESQARLLMQPLAERLLAALGQEGLEERLRDLLAEIREGDSPLVGYAGGAIFNLLLTLKSNLRGWDFSHLAMRQAALAGVKAQEVNFRHAHFANCTFTNAFGPCWSTAFSPDGRLLAAGSSEGEINVWRVQAGEVDSELLLSFRGHRQWVISLCFCGNAELLASGGADGAIYLWHLPTLLVAPLGAAQPLRVLRDQGGMMGSIAVSPQGHLLARAGDNGELHLWEVASGVCLGPVAAHDAGECAVRFSPDGERLVSVGNDGIIFVHDVASGKMISSFETQMGRIRSLAISPDGALYAVGSMSGRITLWEAASGACVRTLTGHSEEILELTFHPHGALLASNSEDRSVRLWRVESGESLHRLVGRLVRSIAFSSDGGLLSCGGDDQTVCLWDTRFYDTQVVRCLQKFVGYQPWLGTLAFRPDSGQLACGDKLGIFLWDSGSGERLPMLDGRMEDIHALCYHPAGKRLAAAGEEGTIRIWELSSGDCVAVLAEHDDAIWTLSFHPSGDLLASSGYERTIRLWEMGSNRCVALLEGHEDMCTCVAFSPDGRILASGGADGRIRLWETASRRCVAVLEGADTTHAVWRIAFSPDGRMLFSGGFDHCVRVWEVETGRCLRVLAGHTDWVMGVSVSPDGRVLASASGDGTVRLWEVETGVCVRILAGQDSKLMEICFSPDGRTLAGSCKDHTVRLWDVASGECVKVLPCDRPYEGMDITGVRGLTTGQIAVLRQLGARAEV